MKELVLDRIGENTLDTIKSSIVEQQSKLNEKFKSKINPENGYYGIPKEIKVDNFVAKTDGKGRPVRNRIDDIVLNETGRKSLNHIKNFPEGYERGHLIADILGGPNIIENIVPQLRDINHKKFIKLENTVKQLVKEGHNVSYQIKTKYDSGKEIPSSFTPKIEVDGKEYKLPKELRKIYNKTEELSKIDRLKINTLENVEAAKTKVSTMHETGRQAGLDAAKLTFVVSTVENMQLLMQNEISAEEMVIDIVKDTGTAGVVEAGTEIITKGVSTAMKKSSYGLLKSLGKSGVPAMVISVGVDSYESISDFATGEIDAKELAYELGESGARVAGGAAGAAFGGVVGGMVGTAITAEAYQSAVELGGKGAEVLADKAQEVADRTVEAAKTEIPNKVNNVREAINTYASENGVPIQV